jgi:hypothetical protein
VSLERGSFAEDQKKNILVKMKSIVKQRQRHGPRVNPQGHAGQHDTPRRSLLAQINQSGQLKAKGGGSFFHGGPLGARSFPSGV